MAVELVAVGFVIFLFLVVAIVGAVLGTIVRWLLG
jgi:membrane protein YqaA with SNARE-associated domain